MQITFNTINFQGVNTYSKAAIKAAPVVLSAAAAATAVGIEATNRFYTPIRSKEKMQEDTKNVKLIITQAAANNETISRKEIAQRAGITCSQLNHMLEQKMLDAEALASYSLVKNKTRGMKPNSQDLIDSRIEAIKKAIESLSTNSEIITSKQIALETGISFGIVKLLFAQESTGLKELKQKANKLPNKISKISKDVQTQVENLKNILQNMIDNGETVTMQNLAQRAGITYNRLKYLIFDLEIDDTVQNLYRTAMAQSKDKKGFQPLEENILKSRIKSIKDVIESLSSQGEIPTAQKIADITGISVHVIRRLLAENKDELTPEIASQQQEKDACYRTIAKNMLHDASISGTSRQYPHTIKKEDAYTNSLAKVLSKSYYDEDTKKRLIHMFSYAPIVVDTILHTRDKNNRPRYLNMDKIEAACDINPFLVQELISKKTEDGMFKYNCEEILDIVEDEFRY